MSVAKIAISIDDKLLAKLDGFILQKEFKTRSQAIQIAVQNTIERLDHERLINACLQLDVHTERALADEGLTKDIEEWPEF
jgi:metal-responsive CopG/Arc/MetJ family transcriptional regulator